MANPPDHLKYSNFPVVKTFDPRDSREGIKQASQDSQKFDPHDLSHGKLADPLLEADIVSKILGISKSTLSKWRITGQSPPYLKIGKKILFRQSDLDKWLDCRRRLSTSDDGFDIGEF